MQTAEFIDRHLSEDQKRQIAIDEWRSMCREACKGDPERIIGNIAHAVATDMVAEALGEDANERIRSKAIEVIDSLSEFTVFRRPDAWDRGPSPSFTVLMEAVKANRDLVGEKVRQAISQISKREALDIIKSGVVEIRPHK